MTLLTVAVCGLFVRLGIWQLHRAAEAHAGYERFLQQTKAPPVALQQAAYRRQPIAKLQWRSARLSGHYLRGREILLDNQSEKERPGYMVYTPFQLDGGGPAVLVNRGWRPNPEDRDRVTVPAPASGPLEIGGIIGLPPAHGIRLGGANNVEHLGAGVMRVQNIDLKHLEKLLHMALLPYTVMLDPSAPDGFLRDWHRPGSREGRNRSYAVQWFAMAAAVLAVFLYNNLKRAT